ncbi:P-loop containing nucleoside triphosphate hydrolase protein [Mycena latifolia]|nr:P-loop containing nucleoside triphosphate hydrolase protein [Mycena latifolia]
MSSVFKWSSIEGRALARRILHASPLTYDPHDYQIEGFCCSLDGVHLLAITPTGSGKTGFYTMYILIVIAVVKDPGLCPTAHFPADPCLTVICPTIPLQLEMAEKMCSFGLSALAISSNTREEALRLNNEELWLTARKSVNVILAGPEQLKSDEFEKALHEDAFYHRCCGTGFDEVHLLNTWGPDFRKDFLQMGLVKARMSEKHNPWILTTATLRHGAPYDNVLELLGLVPGQFHVICRSNLRPEVQILFRDLKSSLKGGIYPELDCILMERRSITIFPKTISLASKIYSYLLSKCPVEERTTRIRMYNSMNFESHNAATRKLLDNPDIDSGCQILIATDALSVGINIPVRQDAIIGDVDDTDELIQKGGRVGRNRKLVNDARVIVYVTAAARAAAEKALRDKDLPRASKSTPPDLSMAEMTVAPCKIEAQNRLYNNPPSDPPCKCKTCTGDPPPPPRTSCNCSGCVPEKILPPVKRPPAPTPIDKTPKHRRLSKLQRAHRTTRLLSFQREIWREADVNITSFVPPDTFLPSPLIKTLLDVYSNLTSLEAVHEAVKSCTYLEPHHRWLFALLWELKPEFAKIARDRKAELAAARARKEVIEKDEDEDSGHDEDEEMEGPEGPVVEAEVSPSSEITTAPAVPEEYATVDYPLLIAEPLGLATQGNIDFVHQF